LAGLSLFIAIIGAGIKLKKEIDEIEEEM